MIPDDLCGNDPFPKIQEVAQLMDDNNKPLGWKTNKANWFMMQIAQI